MATTSKKKEITASTPWWNAFPVGEYGDQSDGFEMYGWAKLILTKLAVTREGFLYTNSNYGKSRIGLFEVEQRIYKLGGRKRTNGIYVWPDGIVSVSDKFMLFTTINQELAAELNGLVATYVQEHAPKIYVTTYNGHGYAYNELAANSVPLDINNYSAQVVNAREHIVADLNTKTPCGRIIILDGPTGTGKTFFVRSLLTAITNGHTIIFPANLVPDLSGPSFMQLLLAYKPQWEGPIFLVIEDADECLSARQASNSASITTLLNLSDGIIGQAFDLRILATTNVERAEIDDAILRPGRLCRRIHIGPLDKVESTRAYRNLLPNSTALLDSMTLAEVYQRAREHGWDPNAKKSNGAVVQTTEHSTTTE
jgi:energy-coupling factor transporter ATP-binding protein EcfA2